MRIARAVAEAIVAHAREGYPLEVCGILIGPAGNGSVVHRVVRTANRETDTPRVRYVIAPEELLDAQREADVRGEAIVGYYHSHPDHPARPSETDRRVAAEGLSDGVVHVVVGVAGGQETTATAWVFRDAIGEFEGEEYEVV